MQAVLYMDKEEKIEGSAYNIRSVQKKLENFRNSTPVMVQLSDSNGLTIRGQCRVIESSEDGVVLLKGRVEDIAISEKDFKNR